MLKTLRDLLCLVTLVCMSLPITARADRAAIIAEYYKQAEHHYVLARPDLITFTCVKSTLTNIKWGVGFVHAAGDLFCTFSMVDNNIVNNGLSSTGGVLEPENCAFPYIIFNYYLSSDWVNNEFIPHFNDVINTAKVTGKLVALDMPTLARLNVASIGGQVSNSMVNRDEATIAPWENLLYYILNVSEADLSSSNEWTDWFNPPLNDCSGTVFNNLANPASFLNSDATVLDKEPTDEDDDGGSDSPTPPAAQKQSPPAININVNVHHDN